MYTMPNCECNEELEFDIDCCEEVDYNGNFISVQTYGHCPKCKKQYKWLDFYDLSSWGELTEIKNEEWQN